ncbi:WD40 repeat-like protein [Neolentinus lepideus HHB14362 ss-1]|uniref:WD40 repeat-like protein n=1 Tax=Neolentinus lepideus HHB14362 ss-1 TaxID=1314782 RepID=A0A165SPT9_9AGAM|nr:WD40 repeat-like protein [Neolentinus lepideus HHB14362 ss-1]
MPPSSSQPPVAGPSRSKRQRSPVDGSSSRTKKARPSATPEPTNLRQISEAGLTWTQWIMGPPRILPNPSVPSTPRSATPASERGTPAPRRSSRRPSEDTSKLDPSSLGSVFTQIRRSRDTLRYDERVERLLRTLVPPKQRSRLSARHNLLDLSLTSKAVLAMPDPVDESRPLCPMTWSDNEKLFFVNGEHVIMKDMANNAKEIEFMNVGHPRLLEAAPSELPNTLAIGTVSEGRVHLVDVAKAKLIRKINVKGVTYAKWNGAVLTAGGKDGSIKFVDTRISNRKSIVAKSKSHEGYISCLSWRQDGIMLASGDSYGYVNCWDCRILKGHTALQYSSNSLWGEVRQEPGVITALAWVPWESNRVASGCAHFAEKTGEVAFWKIDDRLVRIKPTWNVSSLVTSLHFGPPICKEILVTHSSQFSRSWLGEEQEEPTELGSFNGISVMDVDNFDNVASDGSVGEFVTASVLSPDGTRLACAVPKFRKVKIWDVWGKARPVTEPPYY